MNGASRFLTLNTGIWGKRKYDAEKIFLENVSGSWKSSASMIKLKNRDKNTT